LDLSVGDVIATEQEVTAPLELSVQDVPKFCARAGAFKGKKAVQIESYIEKRTTAPSDEPQSVE
jgi:flagellar motor switch protein FliM